MMCQYDEVKLTIARGLVREFLGKIPHETLLESLEQFERTSGIKALYPEDYEALKELIAAN